MDCDDDGNERGGSTTPRPRKRAPGAPYDVGYGKPPKATQFGNRPQPLRRGRASTAGSQQESDIASILDAPIEVKLDGKAIELHPLEATLHGLFTRIVKGQLRPLKQFLRECERAGLLEPEVLQRSGAVHVPRNVPHALAGYILVREGPPPWSEETLRPYIAQYERDVARLKALKEEALRQARAGGENVC